MNHYDLVTSRIFFEPKYLGDVFLDSISLLNGINELLEVVGWQDYMNWDKPVYKRMCYGSL